MRQFSQETSAEYGRYLRGEITLAQYAEAATTNSAEVISESQRLKRIPTLLDILNEPMLPTRADLVGLCDLLCDKKLTDAEFRSRVRDWYRLTIRQVGRTPKEP